MARKKEQNKLPFEIKIFGCDIDHNQENSVTDERLLESLIKEYLRAIEEEEPGGEIQYVKKSDGVEIHYLQSIDFNYFRLCKIVPCYPTEGKIDWLHNRFSAIV